MSDKPTLLLVPGLGTGVWVYDEISPLLGKVANLVPVPLPGMAGSQTEEGPIVEAAVARIRSAARAQSGLVFIVGHSLGGSVSLAAASEIPNLAGLIILDAGPRYLPEAERRAAQAEIDRDADQLAPRYDPVQRERKLRQWIEEMVFSPRHWARLWDDFLATDLELFRELFIEGRALQLRLEPAKIRTPVLVLAASENDAETNDILPDFKTRYQPAERVRIVPVVPARHFLMLDQPEQTAAHICSFVEQITQGEPETRALGRGSERLTE